jgi:hypothetical protein
MRIPTKPFPDYKWRWAEVTPSEGLNHPLRFLGVLRAMYDHQGQPKSNLDIINDLELIERETNQLTGERVHLARSGERNLFRNSDRYWKALGLLESSSRLIQLTPFGIKVAEGKITQQEFAVAVVKNLTLPNPNLEQDISDWQSANLKIRPLELILQILRELSKLPEQKQSFLTSFELQKIVVPLAGDKGELAEYVEAILAYRDGRLNVDLFPDCAPGSNDKRMIREFLLFLAHYGFCQIVEGKTNATDQFFLGKELVEEVEAIATLPELSDPINLINEIRAIPLISDVERQKIWRKTAARPQQQMFRSQVLAMFDNTCLLTGEQLSIVLEACHIIPVENKGSDTFQNGLCLRSDLHTLFDTRHIRFSPKGEVLYSEVALQSSIYRSLPIRVELPTFISREALNWRFKYY